MVNFGNHIDLLGVQLNNLLKKLLKDGKSIAGYGAPAKGNTLLNFCGIVKQQIDFVVDRSPYKQGLFLPGSHIPIKSVEAIQEAKPDYIIILPWNIKDEIMNTENAMLNSIE